jgi:hypothetical protein
MRRGRAAIVTFPEAAPSLYATTRVEPPAEVLTMYGAHVIDMNVLDLVLWSAQGFLALFFLAAGAPKGTGRGLERWAGFADLPRALVVLIGFSEVLGPRASCSRWRPESCRG